MNAVNTISPGWINGGAFRLQKSYPRPSLPNTVLAKNTFVPLVPGDLQDFGGQNPL